jgi:hypothetical protein
VASVTGINELSNGVEPRQIISVKEIRKLLGKEFAVLSDEQVIHIAALLEVIAKESVQQPVPY